ncbi:hypothetical protein EVAR_98141_1 [Eumeta japonica]|uniref:Uncharacterized protein n=1 Tax=Eumeta variegata TaxID=151549 RepID=A0A4C1XQT3_EUMVA|nr:hypothetical protein EVAR_98141_1 [Eumeta japonica]
MRMEAMVVMYIAGRRLAETAVRAGAAGREFTHRERGREGRTRQINIQRHEVAAAKRFDRGGSAVRPEPRARTHDTVSLRQPCENIQDNIQMLHRE